MYLKRIIIFSLIFSAIICNATSKGIIQPGEAAPDFTMQAVTGQEISLHQYRGSSVLLSFISLQDFSDVDHSQEARAQLTFIKSMARQYEEQGLKIILIDASALKHKAITPREAAVNFMYDHALEAIPLLSGRKAEEIAEKYQVNILPATLLVDIHGRICQLWEHTALSSQLAFAIQAALKKNPAKDSSCADAWDTHAQTIFPGLGSARPLSEKIWLADGGVCWKKNNYPVRLLVINEKAARIKLTAIKNKSKRMVIDTMVKELPSDECKILLSNMPEAGSKVFFVSFPASLEKSGQYILQADVLDKNNKCLLTGMAHITVE